MNRAWIVAVGLWVATASVDVRAADVPQRSDVPSVQADDGDRLARRRGRRTRAPAKPKKPEPAPAPEPGEQAPAAADAAVESVTRSGPTRVEFDERLLQGQTNKANAIYLFQRRESALRSLVKRRVHFHDEIDQSLE